jgi:DNA/RNA-binding domain of Phe-tRNA-synthetase-like protein
MFVAELRNMLLTAGHDLETIKTPVNLDVATGEEKYVKMSGQEQATKAGDMMIADSEGILSTVIYGPDKRSMITPATRNVLFTTYAPPGISEQSVHQHLEGIQANVKLFAPEAQTELLKVYSTD